MTLKTGDIYNNSKTWFLDSGVTQQIFMSPFNTAILIILVIVLIVSYYLWDENDPEKYTKFIKITLYGGIFTMLALIIHNTSLMRMYANKDKAKLGGAYDEGFHPIDVREKITPKPVTLNDIPDLNLNSGITDSSDESSDILANNSAPKLEDLI